MPRLKNQRTMYQHSIVFGNGWEMTLRFADVRVTLAEPIYPVAGTVVVSQKPPSRGRREDGCSRVSERDYSVCPGFAPSDTPPLISSVR